MSPSDPRQAARADAAPRVPLLRTEDVVVRFGGNTAVDHVSLDIHAGEVTGLIGPNGAGKTTLYNCITGMQRIDGGSITFDGESITSFSSGKRARMGMARTFQRLELFLSLSVRDNIRVAGDIVRANTRRRIDVEAETERFAEMLRGLADDGLAVCLVEHDLPLVMGLCSQIHVLDHGVRIASGTPAEIQASPVVIEAYIGSEVVA